MCADQILAKQARISELSRISKDRTQRKEVFWQGQTFYHTVDESEIRGTPVEGPTVVEIPLLTGFGIHPKGGCLGFLNHQQYQPKQLALFKLKSKKKSP